MSAKNLPVIAGVVVRSNNKGMFSLNDLHQAAGGNERHRPKFFLENERTARLVARLKEETGSDPVAVSVGAKGGTFAHRDLIYSYAMWISEEFHLQVVRTFDAVLAGDHARADEEARKAVALWENAKKNGFPARDADWMIARALGKQEEFEREEKAREQAERHRQENTVAGFVEASMKKVDAGYEVIVTVPRQLDVEQVKVEISKYLLKRKIKCQIDDWRADQIRVETW